MALERELLALLFTLVRFSPGRVHVNFELKSSLVMRLEQYQFKQKLKQLRVIEPSAAQVHQIYISIFGVSKTLDSIFGAQQINSAMETVALK